MNGLEFANATTEGDLKRVIIHAAPSQMEIVIETEDGHKVASGTLKHEGEESPMSVVSIDGDRLTREDTWLTPEHVGLVVILPGGEAGVLTRWENAEDRSWWRWSVEFYNHA